MTSQQPIWMCVAHEFEAAGEGYGFNDADLTHQDYRRKPQSGPIRVIEKNGGILERSANEQGSGERVAVYWIAL